MNYKLPPWFRQEIPDNSVWQKIKLFSERNIHTVCQEAKCPNLSFCFKNNQFTFMILGDICTRNCLFCAVSKSVNQRGINFDPDEPLRIAGIVKELNLKFVVITSVTRDDLEDGGALIFAQTIRRIRQSNSEVKIEVLIPDFQGKISSLKTVLLPEPNVLAHNLETVARLYAQVRPQANYQLSLDVLRQVKELNPQMNTKSSLMLGLGETEAEVIEAMQDLRQSSCDFLALGQYLAPAMECYPVEEFISIEQFKKYKEIGMSLGFQAVLSAPLARSSYQAQEVYEEANLCMT